MIITAPQSITRGYKRKKPRTDASKRIVYLCDHGGKPEPRKGKGRKLVTKRSIKVGCKAKMVGHLMEDGTVRVRVEGKHTNHGQLHCRDVHG
jgi:hypothetical protein